MVWLFYCSWYHAVNLLKINNPLQILHAYITRIESCLEWGEPTEKIEETCRRILSAVII